MTFFTMLEYFVLSFFALYWDSEIELYAKLKEYV